MRGSALRRHTASRHLESRRLRRRHYATLRCLFSTASRHLESRRLRQSCRRCCVHHARSASRHLESRRLRLIGAGRPLASIHRLTPLGIAATAARLIDLATVKHRMPPHATWNRGDCGADSCRLLARHGCRLTPLGIAATAASWSSAKNGAVLNRLTPPGIAATAATCRGQLADVRNPPHAPRNRGDCGCPALTPCESTTEVAICERSNISTQHFITRWVRQSHFCPITA